MSAQLTGTFLTSDDGRPAVRFERVWDHPLDRVWHLVTDPDELAHWFPSRVELEPRPGGTVRFSGDPHLPESTGRVVAIDPPRRLSFVWGGDELRFDLEEAEEEAEEEEEEKAAEEAAAGEAGRGRTRFTLTDVLAAEDTAARNGAGWEVCLAALDARARGERPAGPHAGADASWKEFYDGYLAAGFPSGAPVPAPE
ncbi:SRPBCC family protein [Streptomyces sp. NPDC026672]|uniref:SRPBCC family protein n=1 Tax=unclassified Streptomyces TaxID=2593676 RepID=UPI0034035189